MGRSVIIIPNPDWDIELAEANKNKRGRPYVYPDSLMAMIAYLRYITDCQYRDAEGMTQAMLQGRFPTPDFVTIWERTGAKAVSVDGSTINIKLKNGKVHRLIADSTGLNMTNSGQWISIKWNVKHNFIKLHIMVDEESQKILAFRITDVNGGDASQFPGMLDESLENLGIPLEDRTAEIDPDDEVIRDSDTLSAANPIDAIKPVVQMEVTGNITSADKIQTEVEYLCDCGCGEIVAQKTYHRRSKPPPVAIASADGSYGTHNVFKHLKKRGVDPVIRVRIDSSARSGGVSSARPEAVRAQLGGGCTSQKLTKLTKAERRKFQKKWMEDQKYGRRWLVEIVISAFKRVLGESVRAVKPEYILIEIATKIGVYNKMRDVMLEAIS